MPSFGNKRINWPVWMLWPNRSVFWKGARATRYIVACTVKCIRCTYAISAEQMLYAPFQNWSAGWSFAATYFIWHTSSFLSLCCSFPMQGKNSRTVKIHTAGVKVFFFFPLSTQSGFHLMGWRNWSSFFPLNPIAPGLLGIMMSNKASKKT